MLKDVLKNLKQHCMSGISYMIPVIVIGGFCTALARLAGNVDTAGTIGYAGSDAVDDYPSYQGWVDQPV